MESQPQNPEVRINPENLVSNSLYPDQTRHLVLVKTAGKIFSRLQKLDIIWQSNVYVSMGYVARWRSECTWFMAVMKFLLILVVSLNFWEKFERETIGNCLASETLS